MKNFIKLTVILFLCLVLSAFIPVYSQDSPKEPYQPLVNEPVFSNISFTDLPPVEKSPYLLMIKGAITFSDGSISNGTLYLTNTLKLFITNRTQTGKAPKMITLYDISKIDIIRWQPVNNGDGTYLFMPVFYRIYTNSRYSEGIDYNGNIGLFNSFDFGNENGTNKVLSYFSDAWVEGKNSDFHWQNSKSAIFGYDFTHPIDGVAVTLQFFKN
jgi:hypothetical protein